MMEAEIVAVPGMSPFAKDEDTADDTVRRTLQDGSFGYGHTSQPLPETTSRRASPSGPTAPEVFATQNRFAEAHFSQAVPPRESFGQQRFGSPSSDFAASSSLADLSSALATTISGRARADALSPTARRADEFIDGVFESAALNPLVSVASPLLWVAARLHESTAPEDLRLFRDRVVEEMRRFESAAMARGLSSRSVLVARYALCATIDDIILNTYWAGQAQWATRSLVSLIYGETWGGERFFDLLQQLVQSPDDNIDVLELLAVCLAIGFVGKYRVMEDGQGALNRLRSDLYRIIRRVRGSYERDLAPAWRGVEMPYRPAPSQLRFWMPILGAVLLLAAFYIVLRLNLEARIDVATQRLAALVPRAAVPVATPELPALPKPMTLTQVQRISAVMAREIADHRVEVVGTTATVTIRLPTSSFASASAALPATETPMFERIAAALNPEPGLILVTGYTDNVRPLPTNEIKTNLDLSSARAASVATMLRPYLSMPNRVSTAGRGDADPIASNATAEGRARNRRVDIQIPAEATLVGAGATAPSAAPVPSASASAPKLP